MDYRIKITLQAQRDFTGIWRQIAYDGDAVATGFCDQLSEKTESLKTFPHRHGMATQRPNIRKLPYKFYIIFYKIDDPGRTVSILRFWHAARDQRRLKLREEQSPTYGGAIETPAPI